MCSGASVSRSLPDGARSLPSARGGGAARIPARRPTEIARGRIGAAWRAGQTNTGPAGSSGPGVLGPQPPEASGASAASPSPMTSLPPTPLRVASENSAQSARLRATRSASSRLMGVTAAAADWGARLGLLGPFHPGSHQQTRELPPKTAPALCSDPEGHSRVLEVGLGAVG